MSGMSTENLNNWTVCYEVQNSLLWKGGEKHTKNTAPFPPPRQKKTKFLDLTRRGKSNDIAHRPIIQVFTVVISLSFFGNGVLFLSLFLFYSVLGIGLIDWMAFTFYDYVGMDF